MSELTFLERWHMTSHKTKHKSTSGCQQWLKITLQNQSEMKKRTQLFALETIWHELVGDNRGKAGIMPGACTAITPAQQIVLPSSVSVNNGQQPPVHSQSVLIRMVGQSPLPRASSSRALSYCFYYWCLFLNTIYMYEVGLKEKFWRKSSAAILGCLFLWLQWTWNLICRFWIGSFFSRLWGQCTSFFSNLSISSNITEVANI